MSQPRSGRRPTASAPGAPGWHRELARHGLLAALTALYVARPLVPSDSWSTAVQGQGLPLVMLLVLLTVVWLLAACAERSFRVRCAWTDLAVAALVFWQAISCVAAARHGAPRPAVNMLWEWVAGGLGFFLVRQVVSTPREVRALVAVMIALALALSGYGLHQYFVSMPAARQSYEDHPEEALRQAGYEHPPPDGSAERLRFKNRLASTEPTATFGLANSLAGYLAAWLVMVLGIGWMGGLGFARAEAAGRVLREGDALAVQVVAGKEPRREPHARPPSTTGARRALAVRGWLVLFGVALPLLVCLVLTKSRSAWAATGVGVVALGLAGRGQRRLGGGAATAAGALVVAAVALAATIQGGLDRQVVTEAFKSLAYRWQYWHASLAMIRDHPWLGCGPGNFQDYYTRYKLPEASEVVADPHNFAFEIWATAGTPALLALVLVIGCAAWELARRKGKRPVEAAGPGAPGAAAPRERDAPRWVIGGGAAGFLLAFAVGQVSDIQLSPEALAGGLLLAACGVALLYPWIERGRLPLYLPVVALVVLLVNLSAAGGIGLPGVAGSLWLLVSLALFLAAPDGPSRLVPRGAAAGGLAVAAVLAAACFMTGYQPVMKCRAALWQAENETSPRERRVWLKAAAAADPWAQEPWRRLAELEFARWAGSADAETFARFERYNARALEFRPRSSAAWRESGDWYFAAYHRAGRARELDSALAAYERAVELYPNQATGRALLAVALAAAGERRRAQDQAAEALRLDALTPHVDQKLEDDRLRASVERIVAGSN